MLLSSTSLLIFINLKSFNNNKRRRRSAPSYPEKRGVVSDPKGKTQSAERISDSGEGGCGKIEVRRIPRKSATTYLEAIVKRGQKSDASS